MIDSSVVVKIPRRISRIEELARNVWWSWHPKARDVFRALDYRIWTNSGHNPVYVICNISAEKLKLASEDPGFLAIYDQAISAFDREMNDTQTWLSEHFPKLSDRTVAYFSMEFAIHSSLPIYAGGLGILAGDMLKESSDLGVPLIGVGFMYPQGYFQQLISEDGWQQERFRQLNFGEAPIQRLFSPDKCECLAQVKLEDRTVSIAVWLVKVGKVNLYLLDTNLEANIEPDRMLSAQLYTADLEKRIQQEIVLGIGGVRVLRALGIKPAVWHANEGHSAFMNLERIREEAAAGTGFDQALEKISANTLFTTHTPVPSGHDVFSTGLMDKYFTSYWPLLGIGRERFLSLGRAGGNQSEFNMTALAFNTSRQQNAVSLLHEAETRQMWQPLLGKDNLSVKHVTNGVHIPSWIGFGYVKLFEKYLGQDWLQHQDDAGFWGKIADIPDEEIWDIHCGFKSRLVEIILERAQRRWSDGEVTANQVVNMGTLLNPNILTLGFARRFTEYKRPSLVFHDIDRLKKIINHPLQPVQIVFAGKSHPNDFAGKCLLQSIYSKCRDREFQGRIAFIEDHDMRLARYLVHGIDVWLNTPYRLREASGTSGMKAAINGIPNLSVRDGWWEEGYTGNNGWAIGAGPEMGNSPDQDRSDAESIYDLLENKVVPLYYRQDRSGLPHEWIQMFKQSIITVMPRFCASRMMKEYVSNFYQGLYPA